MSFLYQLFVFVKECCIGLKLAFKHNVWIVKYLYRKVRKDILKLVSKYEDDQNLVKDNDLLNEKGSDVDAPGVFKVVGVGYGRTGTYSLGLALNELGFPTLHTYHLYENAPIIDMWTEKVFRPVIESKKVSLGHPDFGIITSRGFVATVDFPIALYYEELKELYPDCKFILTVRQNSDVWFKSWSTMAVNIAETTNWGSGVLKHVHQLSLYLRWLFAHVDKDDTILSIRPGATLPKPDRRRSISSYEEHNKRVREVIPSDRLLEYDVKQGWDPLCTFLEVDQCPTTPFPKTNSALSLKVQSISVLLMPLAIILFIVFTAFAYGFKRITGKKVIPWLSHRWNRYRWMIHKSSKHTASKWNSKLQKVR